MSDNQLLKNKKQTAERKDGDLTLQWLLPGIAILKMPLLRRLQPLDLSWVVLGYCHSSSREPVAKDPTLVGKSAVCQKKQIACGSVHHLGRGNWYMIPSWPKKFKKLKSNIESFFVFRNILNLFHKGVIFMYKGEQVVIWLLLFKYSQTIIKFGDISNSNTEFWFYHRSFFLSIQYPGQKWTC